MTAILTAIRDRLRDLVRLHHETDFRDIDLHYGRLTPNEVRQITAFSPAARVGIFGSIRAEILPSGETKILPRFAAVALVKTGELLESTDEALRLATVMAETISIWRPGMRLMADDAETAPALHGVGLPETIAIEPSPAPELEAEGIALWGCLFTVPVVIGTSLSEADGAVLVDVTGVERYSGDWHHDR